MFSCSAFSYCAKPTKVSLVFIFIWISNIHSLKLYVKYRNCIPAIQLQLTRCHKASCTVEVTVGAFAFGTVTFQSRAFLVSNELAVPVLLTCLWKLSTSTNIPAVTSFQCRGHCHCQDLMCQLEKITDQDSWLQVTENSTQRSQAKIELICSHMYLRSAGTSGFRHGWIQGLRCCPSSCHPSGTSLSTLLIDKLYPFKCKVVATSWTHFPKIPSPREKKEPLLYKSLNSRLGTIPIGPH